MWNPCGYKDCMSNSFPARSRWTNRSGHIAALRKRGALWIWVDLGLAWLAQHEGRPRTAPTFSDAAMPAVCREGSLNGSGGGLTRD